MTNADMPPPSGTAVTANCGSDSLVVAEVPVGGSVKAAGVSKPTGETVTITADDLAITADARAVVTPPLTLDVAVVPPPKEYKVGDRVSALASFDNAYHPADVIDVRFVPIATIGDDGLLESSTDPSSAAATRSHYVRYVGFDKRLDEWLESKHLEPYVALSVEDTEDEIGGNVLSPRAGDGDTPRSGGRKLTRNLKRRYDEINNKTGAVEDLAPIDQKLEKEHDERTKVKNVKVVQCGAHEVDAWYFSPYPAAVGKKTENGITSTPATDPSGAPPPPHVQCDKLYVCETCLKYFRKRATLGAHEAKCDAKNPPGKMIYSHERSGDDAEGDIKDPPPDLAFWEVDGSKMKVYCQNLCLLAKLFLDHKTLYFDVAPFLFYVLTEKDAVTGNHVAVGYFSKEKFSAEDFNLACILTLPPYQRRGYGNLLISMSYELSKREGKFGTPERPLSDLGQVSYRSFWCRVLLQTLHQHKASLSLKDLSAKTGFREYDISSALTSLNLLKYWKGQHIVSATPKIVEDHMKSFSSNSKLLSVNPEWMRWEPVPVPAPAGDRRKR